MTKSVGTYSDMVGQIDKEYPEHDRTSCNDNKIDPSFETREVLGGGLRRIPLCNRCYALFRLTEIIAMFAETDDGKFIVTKNAAATEISIKYLYDIVNLTLSGIFQVYFDKKTFMEIAVPKLQNDKIIFNVELNRAEDERVKPEQT